MEPLPAKTFFRNSPANACWWHWTPATVEWRSSTGESPFARAERLQKYCAGFLYTDIEREGLLGGIDLDTAAQLREQVDGSLTLAGGVTAIKEIVELDRLDIDAQVGMALYTGSIDPVEAFVATIDFTRGGGLVPTVVCDAGDRGIRMLAYSNPESLGIALREMHRVLKPGATFAGVDSRSSWMMMLLHIGDVINLVNPDTFAARLENAGFEDVFVETTPRRFRFHARRA